MKPIETQSYGLHNVKGLETRLRRRELRKVCLHEYAHAAVAKHFDPKIEGCWVVIEKLKPGAARQNVTRFYNGQFVHDPIKSQRERRLVGLAGIVAELLDDEPDIDPREILDRIDAEHVVLSDGDWEMIGKSLTWRHIWRCMDLVRELWPRITQDAQARAAALR